MGRVGFDMNGDRDLESSHSRPESVTLAFTNSSNPASLAFTHRKHPSPASATTSKEWLQPSSTATSRSVSGKGVKRGRDSLESTTAGEASKNSCVSGGVSGVAYLKRSVPEVAKNYDVLEKIGEGTFSSVYKACILGYPDSKVALKHLIPTSSTVRIENEIRCLQLMDGRDNVIPLSTCLRHRDHVVLVMPFFPHEKFADYLGDITVEEVRLYMCALFQALRNVHSRHIIHRDVKPSNFLYNRQSRKFQLVDFGLAHMEPQWSKKKAELKAKRATVNGLVPPQTYQRQRAATRRSRTSSAGSSTTAWTDASTSAPGAGTAARGKGAKEKSQLLCPLRHKEEEACSYCMTRPHQVASRAGTSGFRPPEVLLKHPDQTTAVDVWAAGVILLCLLSGKYPFFRAYNDQTALAQIISLMGSRECSLAAKSYGKQLICIPEVQAMDLRHVCQSLRTPQQPQSCSSDADPAPGLSSKRTQLLNGGTGTRASPVFSPTTRHSQRIQPSKTATSPRKRATRSSARLSPVRTASSSLPSSYHREQVASDCQGDQSLNSTETESWSNVPASAYHLLYRCLELNPSKRITAQQALSHPFLADASSNSSLR